MKTRLLVDRHRMFCVSLGRRRALSLVALRIGFSGAALFTVSAHATAADLEVDQANNNSPFSLTASASFVQVRVGGSGLGLLKHTAGTLTATDRLSVGLFGSSDGIYNLSGTGQISIATDAEIGGSGNALFNHSAGSFTTNRLFVGSQAGTGTYNLSGTGQLTVAGPSSVGHFGTGIFNQSGGTFDHSAQTLSIGFATGSNSSYNLSDGSLTTGTTAVSVGNNTSVLTQSGGMHTTDLVTFGGGSTSAKGTYKLNGGTLRTGRVTRSGGTATFNFNGGVLQPRQSNSADFFQGLTTATVQTGGARIDTNGYDVIISQGLLHDPTSGAPAIDGGLTKLGAGTLRLTNVNSYTGGTTVAAGILRVQSNASLGRPADGSRF